MAHCIGRSLLCVSALLLVFTSATQTQAQQTKDVNVVNTPTVNVSNLPAVTGSVSVTNTPSVNVANTPNVNVTSLPAVQLSSTTPLNVKNDPTTPLIIRDADNPARNFFQQHFSFVVQDGTFGGTVNLGSVPANSTLVIEHINMTVRLPGQQSVTATIFQTGCCDTMGFAPVPTISNTGVDSTWIVNEHVKYYVPANTSMQLFFGRTSSVGISQFGNVEISGYLVSN
jgi:hypothetical protein